VQASVRINELDVLRAPGPACQAFQRAVEACAENRVEMIDFRREFIVSVNDPNPAKVHAVLAALADMGIILG
jgi:hypothetical protein